MTAAERRNLRDRLEQARASALDSAYDFNEMVEANEELVDPRKLDAVAQAVILAAAEVRMACRALTLRRARRTA